MIEKAKGVTLFWHLARNPEKIHQQFALKNAKFEVFAIELMNIHLFNPEKVLAIFDEKIEIRELQPPFAEVLSGLLRAAYWPLVFLFSSFSGLFWPGSFFPSFRIWIPKRCKGVHCVDLSESFPTSIYLQNLASIQPRTSPKKFESSSSRESEIKLQNFKALICSPDIPFW